MATIVKQLVTKWTYKVDTKELKAARMALKGIKKEMTQVRKSSILNNQVRRYGDETVRSGRKARRVGGAAAGFKGFAALRGLGVGAGAAAGLAAGPGIAAVTGIAASVKAFADAELAGVNIGRLLGKGKDETDKFVASLAEFAAKTPFAIRQMEDLAQRLLASNFAAGEVVPTLRQLGDVTGGNTDKMNRLLINFVEIRDNNRAFAKDLRQFTSAGVPIFDALAKTIGVTRAEISEMTRRGEIDFKKIQRALDFLTKNGGKFENAMKAASETTIGRFNELVERIQILGRELGKVLGGEAGFFANLFGSLALDVKFLTENMKEMIPVIKALAAAGTLLFFAFFPILGLFTALFLFIDDLIAFKQKRNSLIGLVFGDDNNESIFSNIFTTIKDNFVRSMSEALTEIWNNFKGMFEGFGLIARLGGSVMSGGAGISDVMNQIQNYGSSTVSGDVNINQTNHTTVNGSQGVADAQKIHSGGMDHMMSKATARKTQGKRKT
jgi:tape measure domain-containing protein